MRTVSGEIQFYPITPPGFKKNGISQRYERDNVDVHWMCPSEVYWLFREKMTARKITLKTAMMEALFDWMIKPPFPCEVSGVIYHWERSLGALGGNKTNV